MVQVLELWKSASRTANQLGGLLQVAKMISRNREEQFSAEVLNVLRQDPLAQSLLIEELDKLEAGVKELRAAIAPPKAGE
jgi:hypothetical protein